MYKILYIKTNIDNENDDIIKIIKEIYDIDDKDKKYNILINELRKIPLYVKKYKSLKYDIIEENDKNNNLYKARSILNNKIYKNVNIDLLNDLKQIFNLSILDPCEYDDSIYSNENEYLIFECKNLNIINIMLDLEKSNSLIKNYINNINEDDYIKFYFLEINDDYKKYISIKYDTPEKYEISPNKYGLLNDKNNQYLIMSNKNTSLYYYTSNYDEDDYERYDFKCKYYLVLFFDYDKYIKDNYKLYVDKIKNLCNSMNNLKSIQEAFKKIYNDNDINNFINFKII